MIHRIDSRLLRYLLAQLGASNLLNVLGCLSGDRALHTAGHPLINITRPPVVRRRCQSLIVVVLLQHSRCVILTHPCPLFRRFIARRFYPKARIKKCLIQNLHLTLGSTMLSLRTLQQFTIGIVAALVAFRFHDFVNKFLIRIFSHGPWSLEGVTTLILQVCQ